MGINGSFRKNGWSCKNLQKTLRLVERHGARTQLVHLADLKIAICEGCYSEDPSKCTYPCKHEDDTRRLHELLLKADGFILSTPVYWFGPGPLTENFIAKLTALENNNLMLSGKVAAIIVNCGMHGADAVAQRLLLVFLSMGVKIPPNSVILCNAVSNLITKYPLAEKVLNCASKIFSREIDGSSRDFEDLALSLVQS